MKARSAKAKGTRLEQWIVKEFCAAGIQAHKQPGSGAFSGFPHDVEARIGGDRWIVEAKSWKNGWRTGDKAMGKADILVIKRDFKDPRVYMTWETFLRLARSDQSDPA